ncbi:MAG TPA: hypothetical protein VEU97_09985 [Ktedonobacteraceae bacterium]|nr:hypothetical protein [Ktedonobacteraceae bacterium]
MNYRKGLLGLSIVLGVFVGGYLGSVYSEFVLGGAVFGGLLGGLAYFLINWAVSQRIHGILPYDSLDDHHQVSNRVIPQTPEARVRGMQDALMDDVMRFPPKQQ